MALQAPLISKTVDNVNYYCAWYVPPQSIPTPQGQAALTSEEVAAESSINCLQSFYRWDA